MHAPRGYIMNKLSKSCFSHIRELRCISLSKTASTFATSVVHSKLNCLTHFITIFQKSLLDRLQLNQNSLAHAVVKGPKCSHISPIRKSFHWLKIMNVKVKAESPRRELVLELRGVTYHGITQYYLPTDTSERAPP